MNAGHCSKTTNRQRFIPVNEITSKIGQDVSICLPASHAISDCDTTSSLFKIGKRTAYNTLVVNIAELIQSSDVTNGLPTATKYALLLYGVKGRSCHSLNATTMRARMTDLHLSSHQQTMPWSAHQTRQLPSGYMNPQS